MHFLLRRLLNAFMVLLGIHLVTFLLFFSINPPDEIARFHLGGKYATSEAIADWKKEHHYDKPLYYNHEAQGWNALKDTLLFQQTVDLFSFRLGRSDFGNDIAQDLSDRIGPSLMLAIPSLFAGIGIHLSLAIGLLLLAQSRARRYAETLCVLMMSTSSLFWIIGGQFLFSYQLRWFPISGYARGIEGLRFVILPVLLSVLSALGANVRWYRSLLEREMHQDYIRAARSFGVSGFRLWWSHVLPNAALPILTGVVMIIPSLFLGSLLLESFFSIPGMGSYTLDAIGQQDFAVVRAMVFLGGVAYQLGLLLTDLSYLWADPRVRLS